MSDNKYIEWMRDRMAEYAAVLVDEKDAEIERLRADLDKGAKDYCALSDRCDAQHVLIERLRECLAKARCPDYHCDNEGTTAVGFDPCGSPDPGPCQWCHERREALAATATEEKGR